MKKNALIAFAIAFSFGLSGTGHADTLSGKVTSIDQGGNTLALMSESANSSDRKEYKLIWDNELSEMQKLEDAKIGQNLTVNADQNLISRNWKVTSISGPFATAENAFLRTDEQKISGEIIELDREGRALTLLSKDNDDKGEPIKHRVVWDANNSNVLEKLSNSKVGDSLTLTADQNIVTKSWKAKAIVGAMQAIAEGDVRTLTGEVRQIDRDKNFIVLYTTDATGKSSEDKIVWDDDFKQQSALENAKVGEKLTVRADQNIITRNWKVSSLA